MFFFFLFNMDLIYYEVFILAQITPFSLSCQASWLATNSVFFFFLIQEYLNFFILKEFCWIQNSWLTLFLSALWIWFLWCLMKNQLLILCEDALYMMSLTLLLFQDSLFLSWQIGYYVSRYGSLWVYPTCSLSSFQDK